ncbi:hypothetical protein [Pseudoalteromonas luteoviolacea]|uniref:Uncharacterized protein n=1 Tax=Pseudoalteromonas luteoviolacea S4060-1 TaxID=1365257 RepID=A0A167P8U1_9GAMM|nr:hypothetical protein [Pseudoalteromonas luteoviolacea]KZN69780.1 hypothetical protein N478_09795 [Pseudoalteromonas luteoviolacea S4060-1]
MSATSPITAGESTCVSLTDTPLLAFVLCCYFYSTNHGHEDKLSLLKYKHFDSE